MKSMPASSAIFTSARLSSQVPDQRSGTLVTARPDEQLAPNSPIFSAWPPSSIRCGDGAFAFGTTDPLGLRGVRTNTGRPRATPITRVKRIDQGELSMMTILRTIALGAALLVSGQAFAQQYPTKPVKIIIP